MTTADLQHYRIGSTELDGPDLRCDRCHWWPDGLYGYTLAELIALADQYEQEQHAPGRTVAPAAHA